MRAVARWYDISTTISSELPVWPAFEPPRIEPIKRLAQGGSSNVSKLTMATHTSSHVDAPLHCFDGATSVDELPLELLIGEAYVVDMTGIDLADVEDFEALAIPEGVERLVIKTGASRVWEDGKTLDQPEPTFTLDAAHWILDRGIRLLVVDGMSVGRGPEGDTVHKIFLRAGVPVVECLNLTAVQAGRYELVCMPLKLKRTDGAPARVALYGPLEE